MKNYRGLRVWHRSMEIVSTIYRLTNKFPANENYGLTSQMRRAAISIPSNIAEGFNRQSPKEFMRFLFIALGSCGELETQLELGVRLQYLSDISSQDALKNLAEVQGMARKLIQHLKRSTDNQ